MAWEKVLYAHHFGNSGEPDLASVIRRCKSGGFDTFAIKCYDGVSLMAGFPGTNGLDPKTLDDVKRLYEAFGAEKLRFLPYGVIRGKDWAAEAQTAINVGKVTGGLVEVDVEPYEPYFMTMNRDRIDDFALKVVGAGVRLRVNLDNRSYAMSQFPDEAERAMFKVAESVWSQTYYIGFNKDRVANKLQPIPFTTWPSASTGWQGDGWIDNSMEYFARFGVEGARRGVIVDGGSAADVPAILRCLDARDTYRIGLWYLGPVGGYLRATDADYKAFYSIPGLDKIVPEPAHKDKMKAAIEPIPTAASEIEQQARGLNGKLQAVAAETFGQVWTRQGVLHIAGVHLPKDLHGLNPGQTPTTCCDNAVVDRLAGQVYGANGRIGELSEAFKADLAALCERYAKAIVEEPLAKIREAHAGYSALEGL